MISENISKKFKKIFSRQNFFAVFGLVIIASITWPLYLNMQKRIEVKNEIQKLKNDILIYENKNSQLDKLIKYLESDQYIEEQAKKNLNLKKEGEKVMVIKNDSKKDPPESKINMPSQDIYGIGGLNNEKAIKNTNPSKWVSYFLK
jgi:cell division protein FtsB